MNFENLPADWPSIPLTDPDHIADVLDIFVGARDRAVGSLLILICDEQRRPVQPVIMDDIAAGDPRDADEPLTLIADHVAELKPDATILCAVARPGRTRITRTDRMWAQAVGRAFNGRLPVIGVHLITLDATIPIPTTAHEAA
jgi:hypothetical protein